MIHYLTLDDVLEIHHAILEQSGGSAGFRDLGALKSSLAQPQQSFGEQERFSTIEGKATAYGFFITKNHPFVDGNKRTAHATMEIFLQLNGLEITAQIDEQEQLMLNLASGSLSLEELTEWLKTHTESIT